jgi:diguanylate cyclase (GGDEF)-like protein
MVCSCPISNSGGTVIFSIIFDVTERKKAYDEIEYLSFHDHLTGLYNRRYFDNILRVMADERYLPLTIVMADVNGLKLVNDSFGHTEGDILLKKTAELISESFRKSDVSARIGGDEFAIVLPNTDHKEAEKIVQRVKRLQQKIKLKQLDLSLSFGFAVMTSTQTDIEQVVSEAEDKMYKNKMRESAGTRRKTVSIIIRSLYDKGVGEMAHASRVGQISQSIAMRLGLPPEHAVKVGKAGMLHDIGKIGVDSNILNKTDHYTEDDREEIRKHPESGWRILSNSDEYSELADYVLFHHENIDGSGYPRGLIGDAIPIESRIIAVAEAFDTMTHAHAYKAAMTREEAAEELRSHAGTQFDAEVVRIFLEKVLDTLSLSDDTL